ncbi:MAG: hypothetical protein LBB66_04475 [Desulfovibrio sp.]|nr:hypothetical protein [Desulfovibrio sp.]
MTDAEITDLFGSVPYYIDEVIEDYKQEAAKWPFRKVVSWCSEGPVNIQRIGGTKHPDYAGLTWHEFLRKGKKMDANLRAFRDNPSYYTDIVRRVPGMSVTIVDGKGYVSNRGNHRTCIARCFLLGKDSPFMHGIEVTDVQTDMRMLAACSRLRKNLPGYCQAIPESVEVERDDGNGWATFFHEVRIRIVNWRRKDYAGIFEADELEDGLLPAMRNRLTARFSEYRKLLF